MLTFKAAMATLHPSGFPPYVEPCYKNKENYVFHIFSSSSTITNKCVASMGKFQCWNLGASGVCREERGVTRGGAFRLTHQVFLTTKMYSLN